VSDSPEREWVRFPKARKTISILLSGFLRPLIRKGRSVSRRAPEKDTL